MASTHKHIRSSTANKRPTTAIADGQIALNTNNTSPGLFFKDSTGATIIKVGPVHVGTTAPNVSPASGGSSGNSTGEVWLDTSLTPNGVKIWNGSSWTNATPIGSTTVQGLLELATNAETQTGTDVDRAVTPAGLQSKVSDSTSTTSSTTIASSTAVKAAYDLADAALPKAGGTVTGNLEIGTTGSLTFEGATADGFETTLAVVNPTADRTITLPNVTGTVVTTGDTGTVTSTMLVDEIPVSKLADGIARQLLQTDAAGTGVEWTSNIDIPGTLDVTGAAIFDSTTSATGTSTAASFIPTSSTVPSNGLYLSAANSVALATNTAERLRFSSDGALGLSGANYGTSGQVLTSNGSAAAPTWQTISSGGGDVYLANSNAFTGANTFTNGTGQIFRQAATQDGILLRGRAGGTTSYTVEITPTTLSASRVLTAPNVSGTIVTTGDTGTVSSTMLADELPVSKLADGSARQLLQTDAAGTGVEWTSNVSVPGTLAVTGVSTFNDRIDFDLGTSSLPGICPVGDTNTGFYSPAADTLGFVTGGTERYRVTSAGDMRIGQTTTTTPGSGNTTTGIGIEGGTGSIFLSRASAASLYLNVNADAAVAKFSRSGTEKGSITVTTTATAYNTSSDYRLKENIVPLTNAIDRVNLLRVCRFNFKAAPNTVVDGFLAHEAQEVVPECVTGTKDQVDAKGNPVYQGIDQAKLVPLLTAALQEALIKIEALEAKVAALEGN